MNSISDIWQKWGCDILEETDKKSHLWGLMRLDIWGRMGRELEKLEPPYCRGRFWGHAGKNGAWHVGEMGCGMEGRMGCGMWGNGLSKRRSPPLCR